MPPRQLRTVLTAALLIGAAPLRAAVDRHPEAQSRALAWTEFDGGFLVDTTSRADMLDFYWTVFARPFPAANWTGSTSPPVAGDTAELWRVREYAQLNAYRTLNYSPAMTEDSSKLPLVQAGALVLALNPDKPITHTIDSTWVGFNAAAAQALASSEVGGFSESLTSPLTRVADLLINDSNVSNAATVGHRTVMLHDGNNSGAIGAAFCSPLNGHFAAWNIPQQFKSNPLGNFVSWPAPGYMPVALFRSVGDPVAFRWSFVPSTDSRDFDSLLNANVTAKVNGVPITVRNLVRNFNPNPLTWEFAAADFDLTKLTDDTAVEITVTNVVISGQAYNYHYTVNLFDETKIVPVGFSPQSALKNISTRGQIGAGENVLIAGFIVAGTLPVRVALRTQGPGLARFGIQNPAQKMRLQLYDHDGKKLGENAAWKQHPDWRLLQSLNVAPSVDSEAGMVATLWPGSYTAVVSDDAGVNGTGIVEVFNIDNQTPTRLANLSTRGVVGAGEQTLIAGITIGNSPRTVVIRTQGPALAKFGITNPAGDTLLSVVAQNDGHTVAQNDDWQTDPQNARLRTDLAAFAPTDSREAALVLTLAPGAYTALVTSKTNPGVGIVEVFEISAP